MSAPGSALAVQQAIQWSVAPVFLLTGIAGLLTVMASRLARIIDRGRELTHLERRRRLASWSINFCTGAALLVCTVIMTLFVEEFLGASLKWLAGAAFIATMLAVIAGLACFLAEVYIATHTSHIVIAALEG